MNKEDKRITTIENELKGSVRGSRTKEHYNNIKESKIENQHNTTMQ